MKKLSILVTFIAFLFPVIAFASGISCSDCFYIPPQTIEKTGNDKLDTAMSICKTKRMYNGSMIATNPPAEDYTYAEYWKKCLIVEDKWYKTLAGIEEKKRLEKEKNDHDLIDSITQ